ncbi:MAG: hypothetical protein CVU00_14495 [Bacteroidetes bacterium HGW-Bacteroidetes-17]|jgi:hypothetical protein|nr:MAG: hypothetical protein CVU00_14495 [Bacteroidetes bacterium HGW-Bacteroidetes-17]
MYSTICRSEGIIWKIIDNEIILLNPKTGEYFGLTPVASDFWKHLEKTSSLAEILTHLDSLYDVDKELLINDIHVLITKLIQRNLIITE